ncbi:hypothetical protein [Streptomyces sp. NPDC091268]|uniref:hypothetical protein n=1 Tax=Streptomyces sp. NPDC091268 TaxID=3365979 RepID=UPI0037FF80B0
MNADTAAVASAQAGGGGWADLVHASRELLCQKGTLAVSGPWGAGKSTLLDALAAGSPGQATRCLRIHAQPGDEDVPHSALAQLPGCAEEERRPPAAVLTRTLLDAASRQDPSRGPGLRLPLRIAVAEFLADGPPPC